MISNSTSGSWLASVALVLAIGACKHGTASQPEGDADAADASAPGSEVASESTATLAVGSEAPDFSLAAADGSTVGLADALAKGPVVVVFYRGDW